MSRDAPASSVYGCMPQSIRPSLLRLQVKRREREGGDINNGAEGRKGGGGDSDYDDDGGSDRSSGGGGNGDDGSGRGGRVDKRRGHTL